MPFDSADAFRIFAKKVKHDRRFIQGPEVLSFLNAVVETSASRMHTMKSGYLLWRAQLGSGTRMLDEGKPEAIEIEAPYFEDRMKPTPLVAKEGRANPRGIAYLYLANSEKTAGSELRPWLGASVSISQFRTQRDLKIVDCTSDKKRWFKAIDTTTPEFFVPWQPEEYEAVVWGDIGEAMSTPHNPDETGLNYIPTQIISEHLRHGGADGIAYKSLLSEDGMNVVLFDINDADPINFTLYETEKVSYTFKQRDNTYFSERRSDVNLIVPT